MTDERIAEFDGIFIDSEGYGRELVEALIAERAIVDSLPCYVAWFWNDEDKDDTCGECPSCLAKEKPPTSEGDSCAP